MGLQSARLPRGIRNNNPLNIRISGISWRGKVQPSRNTDGAFEQFDTIENGLRAALINIRTYINKYHCNTPQTIIQRWAPATDGNNTRAYIAKVCELTSLAPGRIIRFAERSTVCRLVWAMTFVECGVFLDIEIFHRAYATI